MVEGGAERGGSKAGGGGNGAERKKKGESRTQRIEGRGKIALFEKCFWNEGKGFRSRRRYQKLRKRI